MASRVALPNTAFSLGLTGQKRPRQHNEKHLDFIRQLPCLITGQYGVDAAHIRYASALYGKHKPGIGQKPDDRWTIPLHRNVHVDQHAHNERDWWMGKGIDPLHLACILWAISGDVEAAEIAIGQFRNRYAR